MPDDALHLGYRDVWDGVVPVHLSALDRRQHIEIIGKSGTGKTTLLRQLIIQDIQAGRGVAVLDPHGDLATSLLDYIPPHRTDDVVYFDPADTAYPLGMNLIEHVTGDVRHLVASELVSIFKSIWPDSFGPRLEYILYASAAALLECQNVSLLGLPRLLVDEKYRRWVLKQVKDPMVLAFWHTEYANYDKRFLSEAISPVQNKVGTLLMSPVMRNIVGQVRSTFDARFMMDRGRILIANLGKGRLGEDKARLLGAVLVSKFQLAAMSRADMPEEERRDFYLYIDEVANFTTDSFLSILSEARKYRLSLCVAHQFIEQLSPKMRAALFGNVGSLLAFRVGRADAEILSGEFGGVFEAASLTDLDTHTFVVRLQHEGKHLEPCLMRSPLIPHYAHCRTDTIRSRSRQRHTRGRDRVEARISRWFGRR